MGDAMKPRSVFLVLMVPAACSILLLGCSSRQEETASAALNEQPNACSLLDVAISAFGPEEFHRKNGKPAEETRQFQVTTSGEVCVIVTNGTDGPPHGQRVSSAWIRIDDELVIGPDSFSQQVDSIQETAKVAAGEHTLSVNISSTPGSFLSLSIMFLPEDNSPPAIEISPADGSQVSTDLPLIIASYTDNTTGVDLESLIITLNGPEITHQFQISEAQATWQP